MTQNGTSVAEKRTDLHFSSIDNFMNHLAKRNPGEKNFLESVREVVESVWDLIQVERKYSESNILERITEPERMILFRVPWVDDQGSVQVNRGFRIEFNSALGPYKGGLRFHPSVKLDVLKFLGFEQIFKNSLTTLPMGGGKGGSDFDPKGRSDQEVMRFCHSFMSELYRHIGAHTDIPAGDIGVGAREIGFLFGQYKKLTNRFDGTLTGKSLNWGGSPMRAEATGYGTVYFVQELLATREETLEGKKVVISGSGNVAQYAAEKVMQLGGSVIALSDSRGTVHIPSGIQEEQLEYVKHLKNVKRGTLSEFADKYGYSWYEGATPWAVKCDVALPCATENELDGEDAKTLLENGCYVIAEGANKPCTPDALDIVHRQKLLFGPGKAANAGGVAVSGLEMSQNGMHTQWTLEKVDNRLHKIMSSIHEQCVQYGDTRNGVDYIRGANVAGFIKVADSMIDQGVV